MVAPRLVLALREGWGDTALDLPPGRWRNELTDDHTAGHVRMSELLARFPVALLSLDKTR